jgi:hypothetical protein
MNEVTEIDTLEPPVNGTDDREARSFHWYTNAKPLSCDR